MLLEGLVRGSWGQNNLWGEPGSEGHRGQALGDEEGVRHAQAPSPRGVQSCREPRVLRAQLQGTNSGGHAVEASVCSPCAGAWAKFPASIVSFNLRSLPGGSDGKESACNAGDLGLIPGLGRSPGGGHGNPLQYSCLENPHGQRSRHD